MTLRRIGEFAEELFARMVFGLLSACVAIASGFVPVWTDSSEQARQTVGVTIHYGFPFVVRSTAVGGSSLDGLLWGSVLNVIFWTGVVAWLDLRFCKGKERKPITWKGFLRNWGATLFGLIVLVLLLVGTLFLFLNFTKK